MASAAQKTEFLKEHLRYEVLMLRHTYGRLLTATDQLDWNAFFVAFSAHARSLFDFLTGNTDSRSFKASDFIDGFEPPDPIRVRQKVRTLDPQVLHTGKSRKKKSDQKFNVAVAPEQRLFSIGLRTAFPNFRSSYRPLLRRTGCSPSLFWPWTIRWRVLADRPPDDLETIHNHK